MIGVNPVIIQDGNTVFTHPFLSEELRNLRAQLSSTDDNTEKRIEGLINEVKRLKEREKVLSSELSTSNDKYVFSNGRLQIAEENIARKSSTIDSYVNEITELKEIIERMKSDVSELSNEKERMHIFQTIIDKDQVEIKELNNQIASLQSDLSILKKYDTSNISNNHKDLQSNANEISVLKSDLNLLQNELNVLYAKQDSMGADAMNYHNLTPVDNEIIDLNNRIIHIQTELKNAKKLAGKNSVLDNGENIQFIINQTSISPLNQQQNKPEMGHNTKADWDALSEQVYKLRQENKLLNELLSTPISKGFDERKDDQRSGNMTFFVNGGVGNNKSALLSRDLPISTNLLTVPHLHATGGGNYSIPIDVLRLDSPAFVGNTR